MTESRRKRICRRLNWAFWILFAGCIGSAVLGFRVQHEKGGLGGSSEGRAALGLFFLTLSLIVAVMDTRLIVTGAFSTETEHITREKRPFIFWTTVVWGYGCAAAIAGLAILWWLRCIG